MRSLERESSRKALTRYDHVQQIISFVACDRSFVFHEYPAKWSEMDRGKGTKTTHPAIGCVCVFFFTTAVSLYFKHSSIFHDDDSCPHVSLRDRWPEFSVVLQSLMEGLCEVPIIDDETTLTLQLWEPRDLVATISSHGVRNVVATGQSENVVPRGQLV